MEIIMPMHHHHPERDLQSPTSTLILSKKPPLPPPPKQQQSVKCDSKSKGNHIQQKIDDENAQQIHRLIAMNDKLNLELAEVRKSLHLERVGVRELRASHEGEYRKLKNETKKLLEIVGNVKRTAAHHKQKHLAEMTKMSEEIATLRDSKNSIEKKLRSCTCSSVLLKGVNLSKSANELKADQIMANAKAEIKRLLEELKAKDREISVMKNQQSKEGNQIRSTMKEEIGAAESRSERFVTHVDLTQTGTLLSTTTREDPTSFTAVIKMDENHQHTIVPRLDPNPQPNTIRTSLNATTIIEVKESMCEGQNSSSTTIDTDDQRKSLEFLKNKYSLMRKELFEARSRIEELEETLVEQNNNFMDSNRFQDRVMYLEEREKRLEKETHELREQNELLEFRILELEENQDKWSLRSNLTPDSKDTCNCWREKESDDLMMLSSDSGITSPHSHHYDQQSVSPCSISLMDQLPTDDIRAHISKMSKRSFYNEEDKSCFQQMIMLLNSLEALSHDHNLVGGDDFSSLEYSSASDKIKSSPSKIPEPVLPPSQSHSPSSPPKHQKIIATVQPYSTNLRSFIEPKKENTILDLDVAGAAISTFSQETQTETDEALKTNAELYAEIEKLNRFRKKMEESSKLSNLSSVTSIPSTSAQCGSSIDCDTIERRHLIFYQERMAMLENKIEIFESTGDDQAKLLSRRLEHEVQLVSKVNQLQDAVEKLRQKNQELEENNCELEEIENETRLRCQKLEEEFEVMNQRNSELEMTKNCYQDKFEEARDNVEYMEECLQATEERIRALESREKELKRRLQLSQSFIPAVALFQMWKMKKMLLPPMVKAPPQQKVIDIPEDHPIHQKVIELQTREKQLTQNINDLNRAYQETLENADNLWAQMEKEYKDKIALYEKLEASLRLKVQQLEKRLLRDTEDANERISSLEENEYQLKNRAGKLNRDLKEQQKKNTELLDELQSAKDENQKLQAYINGPAAENIEREKKKLRRAEEDLQIARNALKDAENAHKNEQILLKRQLQKMHRELKNFEVTNGELREEVETLERRIIELETYQVGDKNRIQELIDELESKSQHNQNVKPVRAFKQPSTPLKSLAQELNQKPQPVPRQKTVPIIERCDRSSFAFADAISKFEKNCCEESPKRELKSLADCIISNAETNGYVPIKRSFVEEARQKFSKWM